MIYTDFSIGVHLAELETLAKDSGMYGRLARAGIQIINQLMDERDKLQKQGPWIRQEEAMPEPLTSVLVCRPARAKGDPLTVDMGYLRPDGTWRVHGTPLNRVLGWMPAPKGMEED